MARILGLDLGRTALRALLMEGSRSNPHVTYFHVPREVDADPQETLRGALTELSSQLGAPPEQTFVSLPGPSHATHVVNLPFTDTKRIDAALPFEVEGQIPFDLSEVAYDAQPLPRAPGEKKTDLLVGVVRKDELRGLIATLNEAGLDPKVVTYPDLACQNLLRVLPSDGRGPVAVLDLGHERTTLAIGPAGGGLMFARTFAGGGKALAGAQGLSPILRELRPTLKSFTARSRQTVGRVYLCGGGALIEGIESRLTAELGIPTERLACPGSFGSAIPEEEWPQAAQASALALRAQASGTSAPRFNLRRGEFAFLGHYDYLRERLGVMVAFALSLILLLVGYGVVRNMVLAQNEARLDDAMCSITQRVLGRCEKNFDRALNMLGGQKSPAAALPQLSAVELLSEVTSHIPKDANVTLDQMVINLDRVTLRGTTDGSQQIDRIASALQKYECFKDVKEGKIERSKDGQHVSFRFDIQVQCPDATTGNG